MFRQLEPMQIELFVDRCFARRNIHQIVARWRVDMAALKDIVVTHLKEMGIHFVKPFQNQLVFDVVLHTLQNSREIVALVKKAEADEKKRMASRHSGGL